jgi:benzoyl-CoA reductase/2-hydroxyglutaryl-CoA dehydratase subunit BcrC/BadD/HgdB
MTLDRLPSIPSRLDVARAQHERGGLVAAVLPIHYPRALLRAFDVLPIEVWGPPNIDATRAASRLPPYACSIVRNALAFLESGGLQVADLLVVPHACDSLQGLGSVLIDFVRPRQPVLPFYMPRTQGAESVSFLVEELRALYRRLAEVTGKAPTEAEFLQSILEEEAADALLLRVCERRPTLPLTTFDFYRLIRSREFLPLDSFGVLAEASLAWPPSGALPPKIPILLSGIVPEPMEMLRAVEDLGASIVADDLACSGRRLYPAGSSREPFARLAESLLGGPPDPTRGSPIQARLDHILNLARSSGARGIVFHDVKFCEPELFDLPALRHALRAAGLPSIAVEVDLNDAFSHQARTRLEAFIEMIA